MNTTKSTDDKLKALFDEFDSLNERYDDVSESEQEEICELQDTIISEVFSIARGSVVHVEFAKRVLSILASSEEWNADTLNDIATAAEMNGLASVNGNGKFQSKEN